MKPLFDLSSWRGFYAIIDLDTILPKSPVEIAKQLLTIKPIALQLRAKNCSAKEMLSIASPLAKICQNSGTPFIVNDRADIAALSGAFGVHIGQDDLPIEHIRKAFPSLCIGLSTHNLSQVNEALQKGADYLGFGPVFQTSSKKNPDPTVGISLVQDAIQKAGSIPVVAIGGITRAHIPVLQKANVRVVTSIGDVLLSEESAKVAEQFHLAFTA